MEHLRNITSPRGYSTLTVFDGVGNALWLLRDGQTVWLPVSVGMEIELRIQNHIGGPLAFPIIVGNPDGTEARNIWQDQPVDPNHLTGRGGYVGSQ